MTAQEGAVKRVRGEQQVVRRDAASQRVVVYDTAQERLVVMQEGGDQACCPTCLKPLSSQSTDSFVDPDYFEFLRHAHRSSAAAEGYYSRFFQEVKKLGSGSFGSVYLANHVLDGTELGFYAVKKVALSDDPEWKRRVFREVRAMERVHHPNIVGYKHTWIEQTRISDFGPKIPCLFILMEYANSGNLDDFIWPDDETEAHTRIEETDIVLIAHEIALGLRHLHHLGMSHRDLKPANVLLSREHDVVSNKDVIRLMLADFGQTETLLKSQQLPRTGFTGTPLYSAPEILLNLEFGTACDIYSLGTVLYALAFGCAPYQRAGLEMDPKALGHRILHDGTVPFPAHHLRSQELVALLQSLMNPDADQRPSADDVVSLIEAYGARSGRPEPAGRTGPPMSPVVPSRPRLLSLLAAEARVRDTSPTRPAPLALPVPRNVMQPLPSKPVFIAYPTQRSVHPIVPQGSLLLLRVLYHTIFSGPIPPLWLIPQLLLFFASVSNTWPRLAHAAAALFFPCTSLPASWPALVAQLLLLLAAVLTA